MFQVFAVVVALKNDNLKSMREVSFKLIKIKRYLNKFSSKYKVISSYNEVLNCKDVQIF